MTENVAGITIPDSQLTREITEPFAIPRLRCCSIIPVECSISRRLRASGAG